MFENISQVKKFQKRPDGIFGTYMTRPVSHVFAYWACKAGMSPNAVSLISFLFCAASVVLLFLGYNNYIYIIIAAALWWMGGILDAADGDLARYAGRGSDYGKWFDSYLDRIKELLVFSVLGYASFKMHNNDLYLVLGFLAVFSNVMSGYVSNTKDLFIKGRSPEIVLNKKFILGMVDTRDFFVIFSLVINEFRVALLCYSTIFVIVFVVQTIIFIRKYYQYK